EYRATKRVEQFERQLYGFCSSIFSEITNNQYNLLSWTTTTDRFEKLLHLPIENFAVYKWSDNKWDIFFSAGEESFHTIYLSKEFNPLSFTDKFYRLGELWIYNKNTKNIENLHNSVIVCGYKKDKENFLFTAKISPVLVSLIVSKDSSVRNRAIVLSLLLAFLIAIIITFVFHNNLVFQINKISKYAQDERNEPDSIWNTMEPVLDQITSLHKNQQEMRFEFEREAAVITAKSEARYRSLSLLRDITSIGNSATDIAIMMKQFLEKLNRFFHTYAATSFIIRDDGKVDLYVTDNVPDEFIGELNDKIRENVDEIFRRRVNKTGFVFLEEAKFVTQGTIFEKIARKIGVIGYVRIPLVHRNEYLGAIHLYSLRVFPNDDTFEKLLIALGEEISVALENRKLYSNLEHRLKESLALYEISKALISSVDYDLLLEQILWIVQESFGFAASSILLLDDEKNELYVKAAWGFQSDVYQHKILLGKGITGWVASSGQPLIVPDVKKDSRFISTDLDVRSEMAVPLIVGGQIVGVLDVESKDVNRFSEQDLWFLSSLAAQASLAIDRAKLYQQLKEQAVRDPLTALYNRRFCESYVQNQARELLLKGIPISIIMVDINGLKRVNDTYGHSSGDTLLVEVAEFLKRNFAKYPIARYGGDEFIIFLPEISKKQLGEIESGFRRLKVQWQIKMTEKHPFPLDFAIGAATANRPDEFELIIDYADNLMYKDKHGL
ncbi:diguanylate cyclase, partial [bacterium]|nr:diguanylate cyclase [bacterium]